MPENQCTCTLVQGALAEFVLMLRLIGIAAYAATPFIYVQLVGAL